MQHIIKQYDKIGFTGISMDPQIEKREVGYFCFFLQTIVLGIDIWLPIQGWLYVEKIFTMYMITITTWCFWGGFLGISILELYLVKHKIKFLVDNWLYLCAALIAFPLFWLFGDNYMSAYVWKLIVIVILSLPWLMTLGSIIQESRVMLIVVFFIVYGILGGLFVTYIDHGITNPWQGVWFAFQTLTTVGFGPYPKTYLGQAFALLFMYGSVALVAILSASLAFKMLKIHIADSIATKNELMGENNTRTTKTRKKKKIKNAKKSKKKSTNKKKLIDNIYSSMTLMKFIIY